MANTVRDTIVEKLGKKRKEKANLEYKLARVKQNIEDVDKEISELDEALESLRE